MTGNPGTAAAPPTDGTVMTVTGDLQMLGMHAAGKLREWGEEHQMPQLSGLAEAVQMLGDKIGAFSDAQWVTFTGLLQGSSIPLLKTVGTKLHQLSSLADIASFLGQFAGSSLAQQTNGDMEQAIGPQTAAGVA